MTKYFNSFLNTDEYNLWKYSSKYTTPAVSKLTLENDVIYDNIATTGWESKPFTMQVVENESGVLPPADYALYIQFHDNITLDGKDFYQMVSIDEGKNWITSASTEKTWNEAKFKLNKPIMIISNGLLIRTIIFNEGSWDNAAYRIKISGNILSLGGGKEMNIDWDKANELRTFSNTLWNFNSWGDHFKDCGDLYLPTPKWDNFYDSMFKYCTNLINLPHVNVVYDKTDVFKEFNPSKPFNSTGVVFDIPSNIKIDRGSISSNKLTCDFQTHVHTFSDEGDFVIYSNSNDNEYFIINAGNGAFNYYNPEDNVDISNFNIFERGVYWNSGFHAIENNAYLPKIYMNDGGWGIDLNSNITSVYSLGLYMANFGQDVDMSNLTVYYSPWNTDLATIQEQWPNIPTLVQYDYSVAVLPLKTTTGPSEYTTYDSKSFGRYAIDMHTDFLTTESPNREKWSIVYDWFRVNKYNSWLRHVAVGTDICPVTYIETTVVGSNNVAWYSFEYNSVTYKFGVIISTGEWSDQVYIGYLPTAIEQFTIIWSTPDTPNEMIGIKYINA